jgi:hypothetical protein
MAPQSIIMQLLEVLVDCELSRRQQKYHVFQQQQQQQQYVVVAAATHLIAVSK